MKAIYAPVSPSDAAEPAPLAGVRVDGGVSVRVGLVGGVSRITHLREEGGYRLRPQRRTAAAGPVEAVLVNSGGGIAAGDRVALRAEVEPGGEAAFSATAAEKLYGAAPEGPVETSELSLELVAGAGGRLHWLPQETILYDRVRLSRRVSVEVAGDARALLLETLVFGREAMGETVQDGAIRDVWRVRRDGRLIYAETLALGGAIAERLAETAVAGGARAVSTALLIAPDAEDLLEAARRTLLGDPFGVVAGASAWDGLLSVRAIGPSAAALRRYWERALPVLSGATPPRAWGC